MELTSIKVRAHLVGNMCNRTITLYLIGRLENCLKKNAASVRICTFKNKIYQINGVFCSCPPPFPYTYWSESLCSFSKNQSSFFRTRLVTILVTTLPIFIGVHSEKKVYFCEINNILFISIRLFSLNDSFLHHNVNTICLGLYVS